MRASDIGLMEEINREQLEDTLADELPALRAKIGLSQEQLCDILGFSRTHLSMIENRRQKLQWNMFLSILLFFYYNDKTRRAVEAAELLPDSLRDVLNVDLRTK